MTTTETLVRSVLSEYGAEAATGEIMAVIRYSNRKKLTPAEVRTLRMKHKAGLTQHELALEFGVNPATVSRIVRGEYH